MAWNDVILFCKFPAADVPISLKQVANSCFFFNGSPRIFPACEPVISIVQYIWSVAVVDNVAAILQVRLLFSRKKNNWFMGPACCQLDTVEVPSPNSTPPMKYIKGYQERIRFVWLSRSPLSHSDTYIRHAGVIRFDFLVLDLLLMIKMHVYIFVLYK